MKHAPRIVIVLVLTFLLAQFVGLAVVNRYIDYPESLETGNFTVEELPSVGGVGVERPQVSESRSPFYILGAIIIGTVILLLIIRWKKVLVWKTWFFLAVALSLYFAFYAFLKELPLGATAALTAALAFGAWKIWKPNIIIHNLTEIFLYGGLVSIFFNIININSMVILLLLISAYDAYAVWKSKHMVGLAKFQSESGVFAGLLIPYSLKKTKTAYGETARKTKNLPKGRKSKEAKLAILGGGDIGFPLLFSAAVLKEYAIAGYGWLALIIPPFAAIALFLLMVYGKKDRFYPAMPFITAGCFIGLAVVWLVRLIL